MWQGSEVLGLIPAVVMGRGEQLSAVRSEAGPEMAGDGNMFCENRGEDAGAEMVDVCWSRCTSARVRDTVKVCGQYVEVEPPNRCWNIPSDRGQLVLDVEVSNPSGPTIAKVPIRASTTPHYRPLQPARLCEKGAGKVTRNGQLPGEWDCPASARPRLLQVCA